MLIMANCTTTFSWETASEAEQKFVLSGPAVLLNLKAVTKHEANHELQRILVPAEKLEAIVDGLQKYHLNASEHVLKALQTALQVFDRKTKMQQRNWAARQSDCASFAYIKEEIGYRVADRVYDVTKFFDTAVDLGCGLGHIAPHVFKENIGSLVQVDMSSGMISQSKSSEEVVTTKIVADEEDVPFRPESVDLFVSSLSMHWINDLPGFFKRCFSVLRPDGALIGAMLGGNTLYELRCSLQLAEQERKGGLAPHISPFVKVEDVTALLNRAGFQLVTLDTEELVVGFANPFTLLYDLKGMAESNAGRNRPLTIGKDVLHAASAVYKEMYAREDGQFPATFDVIYLIGWKPGPKMPKPAKRGSANVSFKDLGSISTNFVPG